MFASRAVAIAAAALFRVIVADVESRVEPGSTVQYQAWADAKLEAGHFGRVPAASRASQVWASSHRLMSPVAFGVESMDQETFPPSKRPCTPRSQPETPIRRRFSLIARVLRLLAKAESQDGLRPCGHGYRGSASRDPTRPCGRSWRWQGGSRPTSEPVPLGTAVARAR